MILRFLEDVKKNYQNMWWKPKPLFFVVVLSEARQNQNIMLFVNETSESFEAIFFQSCAVVCLQSVQQCGPLMVCCLNGKISIDN